MRKTFAWASVIAAGFVGVLLCCQLFSELEQGGRPLFVDDIGGPVYFGDLLLSIWFGNSTNTLFDQLALIAMTAMAMHVTSVWIERVPKYLAAAGDSGQLHKAVLDALRFGTVYTAADACDRFPKCPDLSIARAIFGAIDQTRTCSDGFDRLDLACRKARRTEAKLLRRGLATPSSLRAGGAACGRDRRRTGYKPSYFSEI
jgi:hypothetical protein